MPSSCTWVQISLAQLERLELRREELTRELQDENADDRTPALLRLDGEIRALYCMLESAVEEVAEDDVECEPDHLNDDDSGELDFEGWPQPGPDDEDERPTLRITQVKELKPMLVEIPANRGPVALPREAQPSRLRPGSAALPIPLRMRVPVPNLAIAGEIVLDVPRSARWPWLVAAGLLLASAFGGFRMLAQSATAGPYLVPSAAHP